MITGWVNLKLMAFFFFTRNSVVVVKHTWYDSASVPIVMALNSQLGFFVSTEISNISSKSWSLSN